MKRSDIFPLPEYFDRYINLCDDVELADALQTSLDELDRFPLDKWNALGDSVYAPGKWTVKQILQHLIDAERVFTYRALAFSRDEKQSMPDYNEDEYANSSQANGRSLESLMNELRIVHQSYKSLFESFTPEMLAKNGLGFKGAYSVASLGFIMAGHQRWHLKVLEERYYPLLHQEYMPVK